jgi:hypothetical protein
MKTARPAFVFLLVAPFLWGPAPPNTEALDDPGGTLGQLGFMTGCWEGTFQAERGSGIIEEYYTSPSDNLMLGTTRYILEGRTVMWEFSKLEESEGEVVLTPFPRGRPSEHDFRMTSLGEEEVLFEAPEHDFPRRISYRRDSDRLVARIDDGTDEVVDEWEMKPASCN